MKIFKVVLSTMPSDEEMAKLINDFIVNDYGDVEITSSLPLEKHNLIVKTFKFMIGGLV